MHTHSQRLLFKIYKWEHNLNETWCSEVKDILAEHDTGHICGLEQIFPVSTTIKTIQESMKNK